MDEILIGYDQNGQPSKYEFVCNIAASYGWEKLYRHTSGHYAIINMGDGMGEGFDTITEISDERAKEEIQKDMDWRLRGFQPFERYFQMNREDFVKIFKAAVAKVKEQYEKEEKGEEKTRAIGDRERNLVLCTEYGRI